MACIHQHSYCQCLVAIWHVSTALALGSLITGCSGDSGPKRYELSGEAKVEGQPIPVGYITFTPDTKAGNSGSGTHAEIKDGRYRTEPDRGTVGGPHVVSVSGFDGKKIQHGPELNPMGKPLFPDTSFHVDLPKEASTKDFEVRKNRK
ncbi:MAG: hypothetical protein MK171_04240 [Pirellulales bacterium]|nr:hypothetical protein [Pirellulales bacterium]